MSRFRVSYAQNKEDIILSAFFQDVKKGFYVDVGANHPDTLSVTKYFYDKGWSGINLEPNRTLYQEIVDQRARDINLNVGAADIEGELTLREYPEGDGLSTFSKTAQQDYERKGSAYQQYTREHKDYKVPVKPLKDIFKEQGVATVHFMNIDVEGFEYQVIKGNDWNKYRPQVLCIEANHIDEDWRPLLEEARYELVFFDGLNNYYADRDKPEIAKNFSYVNNVILGEPVIPAHLHSSLKRLETQYRTLQNMLTRQELVEKKLRVELHNLYVERAQNKRLRALIKQLIAGLNGVALMQIEKLNKPKLNKQDPIPLDDDPSKPDLLSRIKQYDLGQYYNAKSAEPLSYRVTRGMYESAYNGSKRGVRYIVRKIRGQKNG